MLFIILIKMYEDYESQNNQGLLEIKKAQRTLDEVEIKMKAYRQSKQINKFQFNSLPITTPYDLQTYLKSLIDITESQNEEDSDAIYRKKRKPNHLQSTQQKNPTKLTYSNLNQNVDYHKITQNSHHKQKQNFNNFNQYPEIDLRRLTEEQLEKSQLVRLEKMESYYRENFTQLDRRIQQMEAQREKIKKDKVLLIRNNEELETSIEELRNQKEREGETISPQMEIMREMGNKIAALQGKIGKIQAQNNRIIKKKKQYQNNMRQCLKSQKDQLKIDLSTKLRPNKSRSTLNSHCPYH